MGYFPKSFYDEDQMYINRTRAVRDFFSGDRLEMLAETPVVERGPIVQGRS